DRVVVVHGGAERWAARLRRAGEQDHQARLESLCHRGDTLVPDGVAGDVDGVALNLTPEDKTCDLAHRTLHALRAMARGRGCDNEASAIGGFEPRALPRCKTLHGSAEALGSSRSREHASGMGQESAA